MIIPLGPGRIPYSLRTSLSRSTGTQEQTLSSRCSGIGFNEAYEYLKRKRKVLKKEALSRAIKEFSSEVEKDEVRSIGTFMRVTPTVRGGTKTIKIAVAVTAPIKLEEYIDITTPAIRDSGP